MLLRRRHKKPVVEEQADELIDDLEELTVPKLKELAKVSNIDGYSSMNKEELIEAVSGLE